MNPVCGYWRQFFTRFVRGVEQSGSVQAVQSSTTNFADKFGTVSLPYPDTTQFGDPMRPDLNNNLANGLQAYQGAGLNSASSRLVQGPWRRISIARKACRAGSDFKAGIDGGEYAPRPSSRRAAVCLPGCRLLGSNPTLKVAWRDVGVNLNLTPTIMPNNYIQLAITQMEVSDTARIDNIRGVDLPVFRHGHKQALFLFRTIPHWSSAAFPAVWYGSQNGVFPCWDGCPWLAFLSEAASPMPKSPACLSLCRPRSWIRVRPLPRPRAPFPSGGNGIPTGLMPSG